MKMKLLLLIISFVLPLYTAAKMVYKSNEEGNIIFSDVPSKGAEAMEIEEVQTIDMSPLRRFDSRPTTKLTPKEISYTELKIISPENDITIRSNEGKVDISAELMPALDDKHRIVFLMDGKEVSSGKSLQLSLNGIDRGTHTVSILVKNEKDKVLKRSDKLTFHLRKYSKLFKKIKPSKM